MACCNSNPFISGMCTSETTKSKAPPLIRRVQRASLGCLTVTTGNFIVDKKLNHSSHENETRDNCNHVEENFGLDLVFQYSNESLLSNLVLCGSI